MILTPQLAESLWYRARDEEYGVIVPWPEDTNPETVKTNLNIARRKANDPSLYDLRLHVYPDGRSLIIQRKQQDTLP